MEQGRLYHYTDLQTLALILKNQTIRFSSLTKLDDPQERETADVPNFGQSIFVSCWTQSKTESIPMWNMYSSLENGVRISLPYNPFESPAMPFASKPGIPMVCCADDGRFEVKKLFPGESMACIGTLSAFPINYTDNDNLLKPTMRNDKLGRLYLNRTAIGRNKNPHWEFQKEFRYLIDVTNQIQFKTDDPGKEIVEHVERIKAGTPLGLPNFIDLSINPAALEQLEVALSPKMTLGNRLLAAHLLVHYPFASLIPSELEGRL